MTVSACPAPLLYELVASHIHRPPSRVSINDAHPERASRVDRPVPISSGSFRPCRKGLSPIRPSLYLAARLLRVPSSAPREPSAHRSGRCESPFPPAEMGLFCTVLVQCKSFRCNTSGPPRMCCKQRTCATPKFFTCNTYKKHRGWGLILASLHPYLLPSTHPLPGATFRRTLNHAVS